MTSWLFDPRLLIVSVLVSGFLIIGAQFVHAWMKNERTKQGRRDSFPILSWRYATDQAEAKGKVSSREGSAAKIEKV